MREFYRVYDCINWENYFFKNKDNARSFLWQFFLDNCVIDNEEDVAKAREEFNEYDEIEGVGIMYVESFED